MIGRQDFFFFLLPALLVSILMPLLLLSLFYFICAVPMHKCLEKHSCMSSPFPIAILNGKYFCICVTVTLWCAPVLLMLALHSRDCYVAMPCSCVDVCTAISWLLRCNALQLWWCLHCIHVIVTLWCTPVVLMPAL